MRFFRDGWTVLLRQMYKASIEASSVLTEKSTAVGHLCELLSNFLTHFPCCGLENSRESELSIQLSHNYCALRETKDKDQLMNICG